MRQGRQQQILQCASFPPEFSFFAAEHIGPARTMLLLNVGIAFPTLWIVAGTGRDDTAG
jgi:hypothetical protein